MKIVKVLIASLLLSYNCLSQTRKTVLDTRVETVIDNDIIIRNDTIKDRIYVDEDDQKYNLESNKNGLYGIFMKNKNAEKEWVFICNRHPTYSECFSYKEDGLYLYIIHEIGSSETKIIQFFNALPNEADR